MGRPRQPPSITLLPRPNGRKVWRVLATISRKQKKKICASREEAELVASQWVDAQGCDLRLLPTRLTPDRLRQFEALSEIFESIDLKPMEAGRYLLANYRTPSTATWEGVIADYTADRTRIGISVSQISNVAKTAKRFTAFRGTPTLGDPGRADIERFLAATLRGDASAYTYNGVLGDLRTFLRGRRKR